MILLSFIVYVLLRCAPPPTLHPGATTDYLVIGSDSGKIVIVEWNAASNTWKRVHEETFGRTGCRRIVPGQYLAVDPKGRAVLIGDCPLPSSLCLCVL